MLFKRSLFHELATTLLSAFAVLVTIVMVQRTSFYLNIAVTGGVTGEAIHVFLGITLLRLLPTLLSLTLFLGTLLVLTRWHRDREMVIWLSSGLGVYAFIRPLVQFAAPFLLVIVGASFFLSPWAIGKASEFKDQLASQSDINTIPTGTFKESKQANRIFFVESSDPVTGQVNNIFVQTHDHDKRGIIIAQRGHRIEKDHASFLVLEQGHQYSGVPGTLEYLVTRFETYTVRLTSQPYTKSVTDQKSLASLTLIQNPTPGNLAELHGRIAAPIAALLLMLLAIPLSFVDPRAGRSANLIVALLIYVIYSNILSIMQIWISQGKLNSFVGLWPAHSVMIAIIGYLLYRRSHSLPVLPRPWRR